MRTLSRIIVGLVLVVPMGAYVAGSLAASADSDPQPRQTIEIRPADATPAKGPSGKPTSQPSGDHSGPGRGGEDDDDVEVITPDYDDYDDDDDKHDDDGDDHGGDRDDDSGHDPSDDGRHDDDSGHGGGDD
jgi:hypothetical protein